MDRRGWNLALGFQEMFTAVVRLRYNRQAVQDAEAFRAQMRQALRVAEQDARSRGCSPEDVKQVIFGGGGISGRIGAGFRKSGIRELAAAALAGGIVWSSTGWAKFSSRNCRRR